MWVLQLQSLLRYAASGTLVTIVSVLPRVRRLFKLRCSQNPILRIPMTFVLGMQEAAVWLMKHGTFGILGD